MSYLRMRNLLINYKTKNMTYTFPWQHKYNIWLPKYNTTKCFDTFKDMMEYYLANKDTLFMNPKKNF